MSFENDIKECLAVLKSGGIILYPTDTVWGIGCDATNEVAVAKIYALKQRPDEKSMLVLLAHEDALQQYVAKPQPEIVAYLKTAKKPTTVIYEGAINLATNLINKTDGSVGIRIVNNDFCSQLIKRFGKPIVSTSANISGHPAPQIFNDITPVVKNGVNYVVQYGQNITIPCSPSSIIKLNPNKTIQVIRP
jgi:L-threonylcarbamoyladenylate synthase